MGIIVNIGGKFRPPDRPTVPSNGPSVHPMLLSLRLLFFNSSDATRKGKVVSGEGVLEG
jgi:hypothetical protein